jgi:peptidyl-prolyl cis-trans isomerase SurA
LLPAVKAALLAGLLSVAVAAGAQGRVVRNGDYIAAVVNQELVTAGEVERRIERAQAEASRAGVRLPPESELRRQALDALIDERAMITTARESGMRVDDAGSRPCGTEHRPAKPDLDAGAA